MAFVPHPPIGPGFNLPFPSLTLHALTPASGDEPAHLYCQVDEGDAPAPAPASASASASASAAASNGLNGNGHGDAMGVDGETDDEDEGEDEGYGEDDYTAVREVRIYLAPSKCEFAPTLYRLVSNLSCYFHPL